MNKNDSEDNFIYQKYLDLKSITNATDYLKLQEAGNVIKSGGLVLFPTETVYGLGANGLDEKAVRQIYIAKGRKSDNPLILHICDIGMLGQIAQNISDVEFSLMNAFWPGPFTIILNKKDSIPMAVSGGLNAIGVRMPNNEIARNLIKFAGVPIAAPSANISGRPSGTNIEDIFSELSDKVDYIIDGGNCNIGLESTVVKVVDGVPHILRPGKVTAEEIKSITGNVIVDEHVLNNIKTDNKPLSPGMKYKHYAPNTDCILVYDENPQKNRTKILELAHKSISEKKKVLIMCLTENVKFIENEFNSEIAIIDMGSSLEDVSKNVFTDLRKADKYNVDIIIIQGVTAKGLGLAITNRLLRACSYKTY